MSKQLSKQELVQHLKEQIKFMQSSCKLYDMGSEFEAKRMALTLRILLYDSGNGSSLLGLLHLKKKIQFISTAQVYQSNNLLAQQCLVQMNIGAQGGKFLPLFDNSKARLLSCKDWLQEIVMSDSKKNVYRRIQLIKLLANKDGGAHADEKICDELAPLKDPYVSAWRVVDSVSIEHPMSNDVVYCSMRQMAYEVLQSLYKEKYTFLDELYF